LPGFILGDACEHHKSVEKNVEEIPVIKRACVKMLRILEGNQKLASNFFIFNKKKLPKYHCSSTEGGGEFLIPNLHFPQVRLKDGDCANLRLMSEIAQSLFLATAFLAEL
jgi:hypothetical protein